VQRLGGHDAEVAGRQAGGVGTGVHRRDEVGQPGHPQAGPLDRLDVLTRTGAGSRLVSDAAIVEARLELWQHYRIAVEHGAATAYAALTSGAYRPARGERVIVVLCGANTDPASLSAVPQLNATTSGK
jgi:hypothetical protein